MERLSDQCKDKHRSPGWAAVVATLQSVPSSEAMASVKTIFVWSWANVNHEAMRRHVEKGLHGSDATSARLSQYDAL